MILKTEGIVLKRFDYRETSQIAIFFTRDYGKVSGILKGIRRSSKKFGSSIDSFSLNDIVYYKYCRSELHLISQCDLKEYYLSIRQDYKRNLAANYMLELVSSIMPTEQKNEEIFQLMLDYLNSLGKISDIDKLVHIFQVKILSLSGFRPHIDSCVRCQKKVVGRARFSLREGGLLCQNCPSSETNFSIISKGTVASVLYIEQNDWIKSLRLGLTSKVKQELKYILNNFLVYHLEKKINSSRYLK